MSAPFKPFARFKLFLRKPLVRADKPRVSISETGLVSVACRTSQKPKVYVESDRVVVIPEANFWVENQMTGVVAIWPGDEEENVTLPYVSGGQVVVQWENIEPSSGQFDWSQVETKLGRVNDASSKATIQINALTRPDWLFNSVPSLTEAQLITLGVGNLADQTDNEDGLPMHWHPNYIAAHNRMIAALADFVETTPLKSAIFGIRQNYNAVGTEVTYVPEEIRDADVWNTPVGVDPGEDWTTEIDNAYCNEVVQTYLDAFGYNSKASPIALVYIREACTRHFPVGTSVMEAPCRSLFASDKRIGVFHTSGAPQPKSEYRESTWSLYKDVASSGVRPAYAEGLQAATDHPVQDGMPPMSDEQWDYWRILLELSLGASVIANRTEDLERAVTDVAFEATLEFADRYAGALMSPSKAPGGWVAFREGEFLKGDYGFLIQTNSSPESGYTYWVEDTPGTGTNARYGVWSRILQPGEKIDLSINPKLLDGLWRSSDVELRVISRQADDSAIARQLRITGPNQSVVVSVGSTAWTEAIESIMSINPYNTNWAISAEGAATELHFFELRKTIN
jgi:hypothetical protein